MSHHYLFVSTAVAPIGSGRGGGVELAIQTLAKGFALRGHTVRILAPAGSRLSEDLQSWNLAHGSPISLTCTPGELQLPAQHHPDAAARQTERQLGALESFPGTTPEATALERMLAIAWKEQGETHRILNFAYDRLPLRLTGRFTTPMYHLISMGSLDPDFDRDLLHLVKLASGRLACHTRSQASTFPAPVRQAMTVVGLGLDLESYRYHDTAGDHVLWMGRISPEKGVQEAIEAAELSSTPLRLAGPIDNRDYWDDLCKRWPDLPDRWLGYLTTADLQRETGEAKALLMTPKWVEAFGIVAIEALACGTPVLAYRRGGPSEIILDGRTGYLITPDRPDRMARALQKLDNLSRKACRIDAEERWSMQAWSERCEAWLETSIPSP